MSRTARHTLVAFTAALLLAPLAAMHAADRSKLPTKPNIVFILADDIGYGDIGCYGAKVLKTPHCDRLAREGVRFTDAHATGSTCTPTRYAFITGQYAWRNPAGAGILNGEAPLAMDPAKPTTPSVLKQAGYRTGLVGKWHIGLGKGDLDFNKEIKPGPIELGFDYAFFFPATGDRVPCVFIENHRVVGLDPSDPIRTSYTRKIGDEPTGKEHPELLTMKPSHGHDNTIINGISRIGWMSGGKSARWVDELMADTLAKKAVVFIERNKDKPFFLYLATHDIHVPRVPGGAYRGKSGCGIRGDVIEEFDGTVGAVLDTLDRLKLADGTLVIVSSDNGGIMDDGYQDGAVANAHGHRCNGPLRGYKGSLWEGGHREPFIVRWPGHVKAGTTSDELIGLVDMMATFAAVAGIPMPKDGGPDSFNVLPTLLGGESPRKHLVVQSNGIDRQAIRVGAWKYIPGQPGLHAPVVRGGNYSTSLELQLYDLTKDLAEENNLAEERPGKVKEFRSLLDKIKADGRSAP